MTDSQRVNQGCLVIDGAVGGSANAGHHVLYSVPPPRNPFSQPIIYGDLSSGPVTTNFGSQSTMPNLFGLLAPVHAGTVPAGALTTVPKVLLQPGSTRVEPKPLFETDAWPTTRPDSSKKSWFRQFRLLWLVPVLRIAPNTARWFIRGQVVSVTLSMLEKLSALGHVIKSAPTDCPSARLEQPFAGGHYMGEGIPHVSASLFLTTMELWMMIVILLVSMLNLTWSHTNLI